MELLFSSIVLIGFILLQKWRTLREDDEEPSSTMRLLKNLRKLLFFSFTKVQDLKLQISGTRIFQIKFFSVLQCLPISRTIADLCLLHFLSTISLFLDQRLQQRTEFYTFFRQIFFNSFKWMFQKSGISPYHFLLSVFFVIGLKFQGWKFFSNFLQENLFC